MPETKLKLSDFLPYQLSVTSNAVSDLIAHSYRSRFALKVPEWRVMAMLGERTSATQRELCDAAAMDKVTVNRATKALVDRDLVSRVRNDADGRSHHLQLTKIGRELYEQIIPLAVGIEAQLEQVLDAGDATKLEEILARLRERAAALMAE